MNRMIGVIKRKSAHLYFFLFFAVVFLIGEGLGSGLSVMADKPELSEFEANLSYSVEHSGEDMTRAVVQSAISVSLLVLSLWMCGFLPKAAAIAVTSAVIAYKGVAVGYTIGMIVRVLGFSGLWLAVVSMLPQYIFLLPLMFVAAEVAVNYFSGASVSVKIKKYFVTAFVFLFAGIICSFMDGAVSAILIKALF